jgi:hypothetical protein
MLCDTLCMFTKCICHVKQCIFPQKRGFVVKQIKNKNSKLSYFAWQQQYQILLVIPLSQVLIDNLFCQFHTVEYTHIDEKLKCCIPDLITIIQMD